MNDRDLRRLAFPERLANTLDAPDRSRLARVSADFGLQVEVLCPDPARAAIPVALRDAEGIGVGDWVLLDGDGDDDLRVRTVLPREGTLVRQGAGQRTGPQIIGANLDTVLVVTSCNREFNTRRIERYITAIRQARAQPVIVLTKVDLVDDPSPIREAASRLLDDPGAVVPVDALGGTPRDTLAPFIRAGTTVALVGSSGVGKSTIINALLGEERMRTAAVREDDDEGRHTTTHRQLVAIPGGAVVLDTPGMREFQLWRDPALDVNDAFPDIMRSAANCRFRDCGHDSEPGCAVRREVELGTIPRGRLQAWRKLRDEAREHSDGAQAGRRRSPAASPLRRGRRPR